MIEATFLDREQFLTNIEGRRIIYHTYLNDLVSLQPSYGYEEEKIAILEAEEVLDDLGYRFNDQWKRYILPTDQEEVEAYLIEQGCENIEPEVGQEVIITGPFTPESIEHTWTDHHAGEDFYRVHLKRVEEKTERFFQGENQEVEGHYFVMGESTSFMILDEALCRLRRERFYAWVAQENIYAVGDLPQAASNIKEHV